MIATERQTEIKRVADHLYAQGSDWVTFYREVFGLRGIVRHMFPGREALATFEQTEVYRSLLQMLTKLRERGPVATDPDDPTRVITIRLPKSMHEALRAEAHEHHMSMNKLCISKLLQFIDNEKVPNEVEQARERGLGVDL